jgi:hypothetical protein
MTASAELLRSLEVITREATVMLTVVDEHRAELSDCDGHIAKLRAPRSEIGRRSLSIGSGKWRLETPRN